MPDIDAITLLKQDHKAVEKLFKRFERAGDGAAKSKRTIVDEIIRELSIHSAIEEQLFYPAIRAAEVPGARDMVLESLEEHGVAKWLMSELGGMDPEAERFEAKATVLIENMRHHIQEEEEDLFPAVREVLKRKALTDLGGSMADAKKIVPTHPHPRAPDTPPGNLVAGLAASAIDRIRDGRKAALDKARKAVS